MRRSRDDRDELPGRCTLDFPAGICLIIINLPVHLRLHNLTLISFGFFP